MKQFLKIIVTILIIQCGWTRTDWIELDHTFETIAVGPFRLSHAFTKDQKVHDMAALKVENNRYYMHIITEGKDGFSVHDYDLDLTNKDKGKGVVFSSQKEMYLTERGDVYRTEKPLDKSKNKIVIHAFKNYMAEVIDDKLYIYSSEGRTYTPKQEERKEGQLWTVKSAISFGLVGTSHKEPIEQLRIGTSGDKLYLASSSKWPTLKIRELIHSKDKFGPSENKSEHPNSYLLDFSNNTLVYGKVVDEQTGFWSRIFRGLGFFGETTVNIYAQYYFKFNVKQDQYLIMNSIDIDPKKYPIVAASEFRVAVFYPQQASLHIHQKGRTKPWDIQGNKNIGSIQKMYIYHDTLFAISDTQIISLLLNFQADPRPAEKLITAFGTTPINKIIASCINENMLFILHEAKNGDRTIFYINMNELK